MQLVLTNVSKTYKNGIKAIDNLDLTIPPGMFGLLGPNGAGKSTLMRTLATLQAPDSGTITFGDLNILEQPMLLRRLLGYLPQDFGVYPRTSAEQLLYYFAALKGISKNQKTIVQEVLELTNLYNVRKKYVSDFSGGMKQRFGIAQLLLNRPKLIIVDEPTAGLDPAERNRFLNMLREIGTHSTVLFSTHIVEDVKELCTDMAIFNDGKLLKRIPPSQAITELKGQIWTTTVPKHQLEQVQGKFTVLSSNFDEEHALKVRVLATQKPNDNFTVTTPNLEDVYFLALQNN